jgi:hypothetical protein
MFSEETAKLRYVFIFCEWVYLFPVCSSYVGFKEAWNEIAAGSPGWEAQYTHKLYQTIVYVLFTNALTLISNVLCSFAFWLWCHEEAPPHHKFSEIECWIVWRCRWTVGVLIFYAIFMYIWE